MVFFHLNQEAIMRKNNKIKEIKLPRKLIEIFGQIRIKEILIKQKNHIQDKINNLLNKYKNHLLKIK